ncbi:MAG: hypothetical protein A4S09_03775 [Proteobacteria bacterium SG_bin7]|nr:MAG: hypothetical protein A4S09_03775 [Proteobacteria bacterium SG_bin7]
MSRKLVSQIILFCIGFCPINICLADGWAIRAREHFETHKYKLNSGDYELGGLTNTLNIWHERPFRYSLGLAFSPIIGAARSKGAVSTEIGSEIKLWVLGVEGKYFPYGPDKRGFTRLGLSWHALDTKGTYGVLWGWGYYLGLGWEFPVGIVSLAPEIAIRNIYLNNDVSGTIFTPSIGVHFYPELRSSAK